MKMRKLIFMMSSMGIGGDIREGFLMDGAPFYGRGEELDRLKALLKKMTSSLVVIKGVGVLARVG